MKIRRKQVAKHILSSITFESSLNKWLQSGLTISNSSLHCVCLTERNVTIGGKIFRIDLYIIATWNSKKAVFGVEIKSCLKDFRRDHKWFNYLKCCDYFCFAIDKNDLKLLQTIDHAINCHDRRIGILTVDLQNTNRSDSHPVSFYRIPQSLS